MRDDGFSGQDIEQIENTGLTVGQVEKQIRIFQKGTPYLKLNRPCTVGDGIKKFTRRSFDDSVDLFEQNAGRKDVIKFVPASGAATRMFKSLMAADSQYDTIRRASHAAGTADNPDLVCFMDGIRRFAFYPDLKRSLSGQEKDIDHLVDIGEFKDILGALLYPQGLDYASLPKGLIKFHAYGNESRTAFEEHLVEAAAYARTDSGRCRLHLTISPEHREKFAALFEAVKSGYEDRFRAVFTIDFSVQQDNTRTIAVDTDNRPFRKSDGTLLFRPGGHGALLRNLNEIDGDIVFIKNIDNVAHDRFKKETTDWKKALGGYLLYMESEIASFMEQLHRREVSESTLSEATAFVDEELKIELPDDFRNFVYGRKRDYLIQLINRPLRVCGMVRNVGEPGGGPFWVEDQNGRLSLQIVETSQIDPNDSEQQEILSASTHFNPVDIVCGVRDWQGNAFDLSRFVDEDAVFIAAKSEQGKDLKALEYPGLWNGAMAFWNTVFVEVPEITFNPVKKVTDLLRDAHQPL